MNDIDTVWELVELEWQEFQLVRNVGGRANCQDDRQTFERMRASQFMAWDQATRESYLRDLETARIEGRNLLAEKYAHMMRYTAPLEYGRLEASLKKPDEKALALVEEIVETQMEWQEAYAADYPLLAGRSRPVSADRGLSGDTSFKDYLRGELLTYSTETLKLYADQVRRMREQGVNMNLKIMEHTVALYGYSSIRQAEDQLREEA